MSFVSSSASAVSSQARVGARVRSWVYVGGVERHGCEWVQGVTERLGAYPELFGKYSAADVVRCGNTLLSDDGDGVTAVQTCAVCARSACPASQSFNCSMTSGRRRSSRAASSAVGVPKLEISIPRVRSR